MRNIYSLSLFVFACGVMAKSVPAGSLFGKNDDLLTSQLQLTLEAAIALALENNPRIKAQIHEVQARRFEEKQAGLLPNPELNLELEEFGGNGGRGDYVASVSSFSISQPVMLGSKRIKQQNLARLIGDLSTWDLEAQRLNVIAEVTKAFINVLSKKEHVTLTTELVRLSEQTLQTVKAKVEAGKVSPLEETKSEVAFSLARIKLAQAELEFASARQHLAKFWGELPPNFTVIGELAVLAETPTLEELNSSLQRNPDIARWATEKEYGNGFFALEKAQAMPDITIKGGIQHFKAEAETSYVIGFSLPLKLFNRNKGNINAAAKRIQVTEQKELAIRLEHTSKLYELYQRFQASHLSAIVLRDEVIPAAELAFRAASEGYLEGKFGFLDVLDAQRTLYQSQADYADILAAYHLNLADLERLAGTWSKVSEKESQVEVNHE